MMIRGISKKFTTAMLNKLESGRQKGRTDWDDKNWSVSVEFLINRLLVETAELIQAIYTGNSSDVLNEAADVANFAMFIADYKEGIGNDVSDMEERIAELEAENERLLAALRRIIKHQEISAPSMLRMSTTYQIAKAALKAPD